MGNVRWGWIKLKIEFIFDKTFIISTTFFFSNLICKGHNSDLLIYQNELTSLHDPPVLLPRKDYVYQLLIKLMPELVLQMFWYFCLFFPFFQYFNRSNSFLPLWCKCQIIFDSKSFLVDERLLTANKMLRLIMAAGVSLGTTAKLGSSFNDWEKLQAKKKKERKKKKLLSWIISLSASYFISHVGIINNEHFQRLFWIYSSSYKIVRKSVCFIEIIVVLRYLLSKWK